MHTPWIIRPGISRALALSAAFEAGGASFVLHACGILGTYMTMGYGKFLADEEICRHLLKARQPLEVNTETIDLATIKEVGVGGQYLTHDSTFEHCRTEFLSLPIANRLGFDQWQSLPDRAYSDKAVRSVDARLASYEKPNMDPGIEQALTEYVDSRKAKTQPRHALTGC